eukprot:COSAG02_NODE_41991_length_389_cov_0.500000_1_plen_99_part_01
MRVLLCQTRVANDYCQLIAFANAIGFSIQQFGEVAVRSNGQRHIVELREMIDVDGSKDTVWVATGVRTLEIARQYYNCSTLEGLPLMGENPLGDGSRGS